MATRLAIRRRYRLNTGAQTPNAANLRYVHASRHAEWPDGNQGAIKARSAHLFAGFTLWT
jgi:hypothetical protein